MRGDEARDLEDRLFSLRFLDAGRISSPGPAPPGAPAGAGRGPLLVTPEGVKYDLVGAGALGHGHPLLARSLLESLPLGSFRLPPAAAEEAARALAEDLPGAFREAGLAHPRLFPDPAAGLGALRARFPGAALLRPHPDGDPTAPPDAARLDGEAGRARARGAPVVLEEAGFFGLLPEAPVLPERLLARADHCVLGGALPVGLVLSREPWPDGGKEPGGAEGDGASAPPAAGALLAAKVLRFLRRGGLHGAGGRIDRVGRAFGERLASLDRDRARRAPRTRSRALGLAASVSFPDGDADIPALRRRLGELGVLCAAAAGGLLLRLPATVLPDQMDDIAGVLGRALADEERACSA